MAGGSHILIDLFRPRGADNGRGHVGLAQHPGKGELGQREICLRGERLQRLNGVKNLMVGTANGVAALLFVIFAHVAFGAAGLVAAGSITGASPPAPSTHSPST